MLFKSEHHINPPIKQMLSAPVPRTAFRRPCMPGVEKEAPESVPPCCQTVQAAAVSPVVELAAWGSL
jgi:hypothetical protein